MSNFSDDEQQILQHAQRSLEERCQSLDRDVRVCLANGGHAAFPAMLYCFATVDLLGALAAGSAESGNTSKNSAKYMNAYMHYTDIQVNLVQQIFRHKLVHLAGPKPLHKEGDGKIVGWGYTEDDDLSKHLVMENRVPPTPVSHPLPGALGVDQIFWLSIPLFVRDICYSVRGPNGYLSRLEREPTLRNNYKKAIAEIMKAE